MGRKAQSLTSAPPKDCLTELQEFCEQFAAAKLDAYIDRVGSDQLSTGPKEFNDAIWGTIKLFPLEVVILDSPIVQRLRFIKQLGVVHWVYPGAVHSRFEHTLGVLRQAHELVVAINEATPAPNPHPIDANLASLVRLCALLHDIGHGVFSHVSEHVLAKRPDIRAALKQFTEQHDISKVQLSEVIAFYLVGSDAFRRLLKVSLGRLPHTLSLAPDVNQNADEISRRVQSSIIGKGISDQVPLLHELISGPFDADKLDYFIRDARLAGVPTMLDMSRLIQKISVRPMSESELPEHVAKTVRSGLPIYYLFGLKWSGAKVLDELHLARVFLYAKIYRHHKVIALESMVDSFFSAVGSIDGITSKDLISLSYSFSDDQLLWSDVDSLMYHLGVTEKNEKVSSYIEDILSKIRDRRAFVNALPIQPRYPSDPWGDDEEQSRGLRQLSEDVDHPQKSKDFKEKLITEVERVVSTIPLDYKNYDAESVRFNISISSKIRVSGGTEIDHAFVFHGEKTLQYSKISGANRSAWADAYSFSDASALIFCPRDMARAVYIAGEAVLRREYGIVLPSSAVELSKLSATEVLDTKRRLDEAGFYKGLPFDIRPRPPRLAMADINEFASEIARKLDAIDEPPTEGGRRSADRRERVMEWLGQFRGDSDIEGAMGLLRSLRVLQRGDTKAALTKFAEDNPDFAGATIVILGGMQDSSVVQAYYSRDVPDVYPKVKTLREAAESNIDAPIVFLDDFIGSGSQAKDIFGQWFDLEALKQSRLEEKRELFGTKELEYLQSRKVGFVFVAGWADGAEAISEISTELGIDSKVHIHITDDDIPFAFEEGKNSAFREVCADIGAQLLKSSGKSEEKVLDRALGYGNRGMLLVSRYNVPSQVLTCLWHDGHVDGARWLPLLTRRPKK